MVWASIKIALANALLAVAAICWLVSLYRRQRRFHGAPIVVAAAAYVAASLASVVFSHDPAHSLGETGELLTLVLVPMTVGVFERRHWPMLFNGLVIVAVLSSLLGLWQYVNGANTLNHRLDGLANHYMTYSGWTLMASLLLVADMAFNRRRIRLLWTLPAFAVCTSGMLLSFTRNAWVGLAAGLVLVAVVWKPRALYLYLTLLVVLAVALPSSVLHRVVSIIDLRQQSNYDRLCMVASGVDMVADNPIFGVGLGMVKQRYPLYREDDAPRWRVPHLHNNVLQIAAERGLAGLAAYLAILAVFVFHTWNALQRAGPESTAPLAGCLLAVAGITVAGAFEYNWGDSEVWIVTLTLLSMPFALTREQP